MALVLARKVLAADLKSVIGLAIPIPIQCVSCVVEHSRAGALPWVTRIVDVEACPLLEGKWAGSHRLAIVITSTTNARSCFGHCDLAQNWFGRAGRG